MTKKKTNGGAATPGGPDEIAVLFPEVKIGPYEIRPWSFGRFKKVFPILIGIVPVLKSLGLTLDNAQEMLLEKGPEIIGGLLPILTPLMAATLEVPEEEIDALEFDQAAAIGLTIIVQNLDRLKNSLPLIMSQMQAVVRAT